jgi:predicted RNase H-like HicB family nuclease
VASLNRIDWLYCPEYALVTDQAQASILAGMNFNAVIERDLAIGLLVGSVPGTPGAHIQGETIEEVRANLAEVIFLLQSEGTMTPGTRKRVHRDDGAQGGLIDGKPWDN